MNIKKACYLTRKALLSNELSKFSFQSTLPVLTKFITLFSENGDGLSCLINFVVLCTSWLDYAFSLPSTALRKAARQHEKVISKKVALVKWLLEQHQNQCRREPNQVWHKLVFVIGSDFVLTLLCSDMRLQDRVLICCFVSVNLADWRGGNKNSEP